MPINLNTPGEFQHYSVMVFFRAVNTPLEYAQRLVMKEMVDVALMFQNFNFAKAMYSAATQY